MPSTYEGFGVAAIEAMGTGLPVILSDVSGLRDFRETCTDIYWTEPTSESIAKAILHYLNSHTADLRDVGMKLSGEVHRHFAVEKGTAAYAQLYNGSKGGQTEQF
jgi:glycosyltransferase involved in cell wall biosynthesis